MKKPILFLLMCVLAFPAFAERQVEDGKALCEDGIDNDGDGKTDCEELACRGSSSTCPLPEKAFVFGIGNDRALPDLDVPMVTATGEGGSDQLLLVDRDGAGPRFDDVLVGRSTRVAVFDNIVTTGKSSLPRTPITVSILSSAQIASGDYNGDGRADLVAVSSAGMQRFRGGSSPAFVTDGSLVNPVPGPASGLPAVSGSTIAVANSRLRLYDECTVAPLGFPVNETFRADRLCASIALPSGASHLFAYTRPHGERMLAVASGMNVRLFEIVTGSGTVTAVQRASITATSTVDDFAYSPTEDLLVFALRSGFVKAANGDGAAPPAVFPNVAPAGTTETPEALGQIAIGPVIAGQPTLVATEKKGERIHFMTFTRARGWDTVTATTKHWDDSPTADRRAAGLVLGKFNDDDRLDVAVLDGNSGNLVILRQTPPACATFITSASHGLVISEGDAPSQEYLQPFSAAIHKEVEKVNAQRRPADSFRDVPASLPAQCPVRHIEVRGHWEQDALAEMSYLGRTGWLGSMWVPVPSCQPMLPLPAFMPADYWASAIFLLIPNFVASDPVCAADLPIPSDPLTRLRFGVAGIGYGLELTSLAITSQKSRNAAGNINTALRDAITQADAEMDRCNGHIYVDIAAHSRGAAVNSDVLSRGFGPRANFNFDVSFTVLDGIDPSPQDNMRPWIHAGYIVGDRKIARRGSEWISSFHTASSLGTSLDSLLVLVPPYLLADDEFKSTEVVGLPVGYARRADLEDPARTFGAFEGPMLNLVHVDAMETAKGYGFAAQNGANNIFAPSAAAAPDAPSFALVTTSHLGRVLADPRMTLPLDDVGYHTTSAFTAQQEAVCMPSQCGGTGICSDEVGKAASGQSQTSQGLTVRELAHDPDFRIANGLVRNAKDLVSEDSDLKGELPGEVFRQLREYIIATAAQQFPSGGRWSRTGTVTFPAVGPSVADGLRAFVAAPGVDYDAMSSSQQVDGALQAWKSELTAGATQPMRDRARVLSAATARSTDGVIAFAQFPSTGSAKLAQRLDLASLEYDRFLVRAEYQLDTAAGSLRLELKGGGVATNTTWTSADGSGRRVQQLVVTRTNGATGQTDFILEGAAVKVFSVSVTPFFPVHSTVTGRDYELVALEPGVSFSTARRLADRRTFNGKAGRLARIVSTDQLAELSMLLRSDVPAWVDGTSVNGQAGSFRDSTGAAVSTSLFLAGTSFTQPRPRGANAFAWPARNGMRLGHSSPAVSVGDVPMAFLVEY